MKFGSVLVAALCLFASIRTAIAADNYLCVPDKATGFKYDATGNVWNQANFKVTGDKYILKKGFRGWQWNDFGDTSPTGLACADNPITDLIECPGMFQEIRFNAQNLRFEKIWPVGYAENPGPKGEVSTPYIEIGTCTPL